MAGSLRFRPFLDPGLHLKAVALRLRLEVCFSRYHFRRRGGLPCVLLLFLYCFFSTFSRTFWRFRVNNETLKPRCGFQIVLQFLLLLRSIGMMTIQFV
ncbi:hypothetical protein F7725_016140 [Dissostichus mawsoni]|uniref:Transmembrane protein n=1 Tax=Dissostichus mawsoni TaxID=36200 RepID=A0A7J5Y3T8_DISMA|nr:hypothetical protein F7725_016140 [Dissostichus mawsoni]